MPESTSPGKQPEAQRESLGRNGDEATGGGLTPAQISRAGAGGHLDNEREANRHRDTSEGVKEYTRRCTVFKEEPPTNKDEAYRLRSVSS